MATIRMMQEVTLTQRMIAVIVTMETVIMMMMMIVLIHQSRFPALRRSKREHRRVKVKGVQVPIYTVSV